MTNYLDAIPEDITKFLSRFYYNSVYINIINKALIFDDVGIKPDERNKLIYENMVENKILEKRGDLYFPSEWTYLLMETFVEKLLKQKEKEENILEAIEYAKDIGYVQYLDR